jgi:hypothetical protein
MLLNPTSADVRRLDDHQLRELVIRLCQREAVSLGLAATTVSAGGDPSAADGGIDVRISGCHPQASALGSLPAAVQVKATPMRPAAITNEMRPNGSLRASIDTVLEAGGTYIIAAGRDDLSDQRLQAARAAMADAAPKARSEQLDFYDSDRLARWASSHAGVALWLRAAAGRPVAGWSGWCSWSAPDQDDGLPYIVDETARLVKPEYADAIFDVLTGVAHVRQALAEPGHVVRLVGLSGMGKTRFAQVLFDERLGPGALAAPSVLYADAGLGPEVSPAQMISGLIQEGADAIVVIDNCPRALHDQLALVVRRVGSRLKLLTIDFDIGPDRPRDTALFRLDRAGDDLIDALLKQRASSLSQPERKRICEFSQGNARIALAIAQAPKGSKSLAKLPDRDLLDRLFLTGRREPDTVLRRVATVAALVYAFEADGQKEPTEADVLAELAGVSPAIFHEKIGDLLERGLAQQRGVQRAILPQAIAAWLATEALARCTRTQLLRVFMVRAPERLRLSFTRRLGLLQGVAAAHELAAHLLAAGGLYDYADTEQDGQSMRAVRNLAPLEPTLALDAVDRFIARRGVKQVRAAYAAGRADLIGLLRALAYDPLHFDRAVERLGDLAEADIENTRQYDAVRPKVVALFRVERSGTHATMERRFAVIDAWLASPRPERRALGVAALEAALETEFAGADFPEAFGAQRQDGGASAPDEDALTAWFAAGLARVETLADKAETRTLARDLFLKILPPLGGYATLPSLAAQTLLRIKGAEFWAEAWFAVCNGLWRRRKKERSVVFVDLEVRLRPAILREEFDTWMRLDWRSWRNPAGYDNGRDYWHEAHRRAVKVGEQACVGHDDLIRLSLADHTVHGGAFGAGLATASSDLPADWERLCEIGRTLDGGSPHWRVFQGYLYEVRRRAPDVLERLIDTAMEDPCLSGAIAESLATLGPVSPRALARVVRRLEDPAAPDGEFEQIWNIALADDVDDTGRAALIDAMVTSGRLDQAASFVETERRKNDDEPWARPIILAVRRLLAAVKLDDTSSAGRGDRCLARLAERALVGPEGLDTAVRLLEMMRDGALSDVWRPSDLHHQLAASLFRLHPHAALDIFLPAMTGDQRYSVVYTLRQGDDDDGRSVNVLSDVPIAILQGWLTHDPAARGSMLAFLVPYFQRRADGDFDWTPQALMLLDMADAEIIEAIDDRFGSGSWGGPSESRYTRRRGMLTALHDHPNNLVREWARETLPQIDERIRQVIARERESGERFE